MLTYHVDYLGVYTFSDDSTLGGDIFQHLVKGLSLDLLALELGTRVIEVKKDTALVELLDEQLWPLAGRSF